MNFRTVSLNVAISAVVTAGALAVASTAEAAALSGKLTLTGDKATVPNLTVVNTSGNLVFGNPITTAGSTGDFASLAPGGIDIKPLTLALNSIAAGVPGTVTKAYTGTTTNPFIDFGTRTIGSTIAPLLFALNTPSSFAGTETTIGALRIETASGSAVGKFIFGTETIANGAITAFEFNEGSGYTISLSAQPIPAPVLLPGLICLGLGALRRKAETTAEASSEA